MILRTPLFVALAATLIGGSPSMAKTPDIPDGWHAASTTAPTAVERKPFYIRHARGRQSETEASLRGVGGEITSYLKDIDTFVVNLPAQAAAGLSSQASVALVEPVPEHRLMQQVVPWNIDQFQARDVWDKNRDGVVDTNAPDGSGIKICIIDSGIHIGHSDFAGITITGTTEGNVGTWNSDGSGHGTHVAGTINAMNNTRGVVGVLPGGAELYIVKVFNDSGTWGGGSLANAANKCRLGGASVISMSLGGGANQTEENMFQSLYDTYGILNVAAAGNDGNDAASAPASYESVVSVGAIDEEEVAASFSQTPFTAFDPNNPPANAEWDVVEFAGGGVQVLSTVPSPNGEVPNFSVTVGTSTTYGSGMTLTETGTAVLEGTATAQMVDGGRCLATNAAWSGKVVLCERGDLNFSAKVNNVRTSGGLGAVIYNNVAGAFGATCAGGCTTPYIPAITMSQAKGQALLASAGQTVTLTASDGSPCASCNGGYAYYDGTSMATPGVSAAMSFVWNACGGPVNITNKQLRLLLRETAKDLTGVQPADTTPVNQGGAGEDPSQTITYGTGYDRVTGWGLPQLADALARGHELYGTNCPIGLIATPSSRNICLQDTSSTSFDLTLNNDFLGSTTLSVSGAPAGASGSFGTNPVVHPTKTSTYTLSNLGSVPNGRYTLGFTATDSSDPNNLGLAQVNLAIAATEPGVATLLSPANGASNVSSLPTLSWQAVSGADSYLVEVSTTADFSNIVHTATITGTSLDVSTMLADNTQYFWRVAPANACGNATPAVASFRTAQMFCATPSLAIPERVGGNANSCPTAYATSTITIPATGTIADVNIAVMATHSWVGDVEVVLTRGAQTNRAMITRPGGANCSGANIDATLDDEASAGVNTACPPAGTYQPASALSVFDGTSINGTWTLGIRDCFRDTSAGVLNAWCVIPTFTGAGTNTPPAFQGDPYTFSVPALSPAATLVGDTNATDPDAGQTLSYAITGGNTGNAFSINSSTGEIRVATPAAVTSANAPFTLQLTVSDGVSGSDTAIATINVATSGSHSVTASSTGNGSISPASQSVASGGTASFTVTPAAGYHVASVSGDTCTVTGSGTSYSAANIQADCAVTATFAIDEFTVTASSGGNGSITPASQTVAFDGTASFTVTPSAGYHVASVSGDTCTVTGSGTSYAAANIQANCAVTATFAIDEFTVTASSGGNGSITPASQTVAFDGTASFTVTPAAGYHVASVSGDTCTVTGSGTSYSAANIQANCAVTATFAIDEFTVTASSGGNGSITPLSQMVAFGGTANFAVTPDVGYEVANVSGDTCTVTGSGTSYAAANIQANCAVTAEFMLQGEPGRVVISELRFRGPSGGNDEFIELYNAGGSAMIIGGFRVNGSSNTGGTGTRFTIPSGVTLNPGCYYLAVNTGTNGYSGSVAGNQTYTTGFGDDGGVALLDASNAIVDQVGLSNGSAYKEGTPLASLGSTNLNRGYERKLGGAFGNGVDTGNNSADFALLSPSNPQNLASDCVPPAVAYNVTPSVTGNGSISPNTVQLVTSGSTTTFTLTAQAGHHIVDVTGDCPAGSLSGAGTASGSYTTGSITADCSVTANFAIDEFTVTASSSGNGTITPASQTVTFNGTASFTVTPAAGYEVASVSGDTCTVTGSGTSYSAANIQANCAVTATFALVEISATVTLSNLAQTYTGSPLSVGVTTDPAGLAVEVTYDGSTTAPTNAGTYAVVATITEAGYTGSATGSFVIGKAAATVTLGDLAQTFDGSPKPVSVTTAPAGLTVDVTYDGSATAPSAVGSYAVVATVNDSNYEGSASGTLEISEANATVTLSNLAQTYTGSPLSVGVTTDPAGLAVSVTYDGSTTAPTNAGTYAVVATITEAGYTGSATGSFVIGKATATVTLGDLAQTFDGSPKAVSVTTAPAGLAVDVTYDGSATAPSAVGSYAVVATVNDSNYEGSTSGTLEISASNATVTLSNLAQTYTGSPLSVGVTTDPAGLAVEVTYDGSTTAPTNAGTYAVVATITEAGYTGSATGSFVIGKATATVTLGDLAQTFDGSPKAVSVTTAPAGLAVDVTYDGSATAPSAVGSYAVVANVNDSNHEGSANGTLVISEANATVTLSNLAQTYTGSPLSVGVATNPAGLAVSVTYDGSTTAPTNAGTYAVVATITEPGYTGSASGSFVIGKATATVTLGDLAQTFDGSPKAASVTTNPAGLTVDVTYDGSASAPSAVGSYAVVATVNDSNHEGSANGTLVIAAGNADPVASVLPDLAFAAGAPVLIQTAAAFVDPDGDTLAFSATGLPASLSIDPVSGAISGSTTVGDIGSYAVTVTVDDGAGGTAQSSFTLVIGPARIFGDGFED